MIWSSLQRRDWEILRTICRLRYVTTQQIVATFFATPSVGRRRLRRLSGLDLITTHRKGVPEQLPYYAWRLTPRGLDAVAEAFPDEPIPDGLGERLADGSLYHLDHRAALTRLYLALLAGRSGPMPGEALLGAVRAVVDAHRVRAAQFWWQPDGDVVIRFSRLGQDAQIVPDATVCGRHRPVRVFVEMDRATRGLARIGEALERYAWFLANDYRRVFSDGRTPSVVYVVPSAGRKSGVAELAARALGEVAEWGVVTEPEAGRWLEHVLVDSAQEGTIVGAEIGATSRSPETLREVAKSIYTWARTYEQQLRTEGRTLPPEGEQLLLELYRELRGRRPARNAG